MHCEIRQHNERTAINPETDAVPPQRLDVEAKAGQDSRAGDFDIEAVFVVNEAEVLDLIDNKTFKRVMEYR
jgi:hypothetical protein